MKAMLSFDIEEFDVPREHGVALSLQEGMEVSLEGTLRILDCLKANGIVATFFCTGNFAQNAPQIIHRLVNEGHEVACHGVDHFKPLPTDVEESKRIVEEISGTTVLGYRMQRMFPVSNERLRNAGYKYNSSLNPTFIPGRYMHLSTPRTRFEKDGITQLPTSVTPWLRLPLFWLSLHNFPQGIYNWLAKRTLRHDGYFTTYFHPWEFFDLNSRPQYKIPFYIRRHSGEAMVRRLQCLIDCLKGEGAEFTTFSKFLEIN